MRRVLLIVVALLSLVGAGYYGLHAQATTPFSYQKASFLSQTGSLATTTLFTPTASGDFLIYTYIEIPGSCLRCTQVTPTIYWTDSNGARSASLLYGAEAQLFGNSAYLIHVASGNAVQVSTSYYTSDSEPYNFYLTIIGN